VLLERHIDSLEANRACFIACFKINRALELKIPLGE
jgi:hypothetical protein